MRRTQLVHVCVFFFFSLKFSCNLLKHTVDNNNRQNGFLKKEKEKKNKHTHSTLDLVNEESLRTEEKVMKEGEN